jgi:hypothetical protein
MIRINLIGAVLFGLAGCVTFFAGKLWFPIVWWVLGAFWYRRYRWAQEAPFLELDAEGLSMYVGDRQHRLPWSEVQAIDEKEDRITLDLLDGTHLGFKRSDLAQGDFPRFTEACRSLREAARS